MDSYSRGGQVEGTSVGYPPLIETLIINIPPPFEDENLHALHDLIYSQDSRDSSLGSNHSSSGSGRSGGSLSKRHHYRGCTPEMLSLLGMLEAVMAALEEPRGEEEGVVMCSVGIYC